MMLLMLLSLGAADLGDPMTPPPSRSQSSTDRADPFAEIVHLVSGHVLPPVLAGKTPVLTCDGVQILKSLQWHVNTEGNMEAIRHLSKFPAEWLAHIQTDAKFLLAQETMMDKLNVSYRGQVPLGSPLIAFERMSQFNAAKTITLLNFFIDIYCQKFNDIPGSDPILVETVKRNQETFETMIYEYFTPYDSMRLRVALAALITVGVVCAAIPVADPNISVWSKVLLLTPAGIALVTTTVYAVYFLIKSLFKISSAAPSQMPTPSSVSLC